MRDWFEALAVCIAYALSLAISGLIVATLIYRILT